MVNNMISNIRNNTPIVHCITNYVTVNDCANMLLACGASPIMADDINEVVEITSLSDAAVINIGTLNERTVESMIAMGKKANELGHPVILDPVGAGASAFRTQTTLRLLHEIQFTVIKGNISEIKTIYKGSGSTKGVDADIADVVTESNLTSTVDLAIKLSEITKSIIVITGEIDIIADNGMAATIRNGVSEMSAISGTGCMLASVIAAFCAANPGDLFTTVAIAVAAMGICGELALARKRKEGAGNASFRTYLIDAMSNLTEELLSSGLRAVFTKSKLKQEALRMYAVTDRTWRGGRELTEVVEESLKGGATCLQFRETELEEEIFLREAKRVQLIAQKYNVPFIVNNEVDIARKIDADGVHVGQTDMDLEETRRILGPAKIIGVSVHTVEQALKAQSNGADYIGVGAVFNTATKPEAKVVSYETIQEICKAVNIPVVLIGGISKENISNLKGCGADGVAVISAIYASDNIEAATRQLLELSKEVFCE